MNSRILVLIFFAFCTGLSFAQNLSAYEMLSAYKNFLNGAFDTQEGCKISNASNSTHFYIPQSNDTIVNEVRVVRNGSPLVAYRNVIKKIVLIDESKKLIRQEEEIRNETTGAVFSSTRIVKFDGDAIRTIDRIEDGKVVTSDGIIVARGLQTKPFYKCWNIEKTSNQPQGNPEVGIKDRLAGSKQIEVQDDRTRNDLIQKKEIPTRTWHEEFESKILSINQELREIGLKGVNDYQKIEMKKGIQDRLNLISFELKKQKLKIEIPKCVVLLVIDDGNLVCRSNKINYDIYLKNRNSNLLIDMKKNTVISISGVVVGDNHESPNRSKEVFMDIQPIVQFASVQKTNSTNLDLTIYFDPDVLMIDMDKKTQEFMKSLKRDMDELKQKYPQYR
jgi:hypothetical protein